MAEPERIDGDPVPEGRYALARADLLRLMTWLSPAFPVGAFSYSHGLEWAIERGWVRDAGSLSAWLTDLLDTGSGWNDAVLFAEGWRAACGPDAARLEACAELAAAMAPSKERRLETLAQGRAFLSHLDAWPCAAATLLLKRREGPAYPVAVAAAAGGHGIGLEEALAAYLQAFAANLVSAAVRLVPLGQSEGLAVLACLSDGILAVAGRAAASDLEDLGAAAMVSDIASMAHETQYSRVFRT